MTDNNSPMYDLAMGWVDFGASVFPCRNADGTDMNYATGEYQEYKEKTPLITSGLNGASKVEKVISRWWKKFPDAIPGIPTGKSAGFWILDVDVPSDKHKEDGRIWVDEMTAIHGPLPHTKICQTANGGYQYFFKHVDGVKNGSGKGREGGLGRGVDVRGEGGYIIAPGSLMKDGRFYEWIENDAEVADAPQWLLDIVIGKSHAPKSVDRAGSNHDANGNQARAYGLSVLEAEASVLASETEGGRGSAANTAAFNCGGLAEHCGISYAEIEASLYDACVANGLVQKDGANKVMRDLKRQITAGMRKPRSAPELKKKDKGNENSITMAGLNKIAKKARELANKPEWDRNEKDTYETALEEDDDEPDVFPCIPWDYSEKAEWIKPRVAMFPPHHIERLVSMTVSTGGVGKTSLSLVEAISAVTGRNLLGFKPKHKRKVWVINLEDPREDIDRKIHAILLYFKIPWEEVKDGLFVGIGREHELKVAKKNSKFGISMNEELIGTMIEHIIKNKIDMLIIDPFVSTHSVSENDNGEMDFVVKVFNKIADETGCSVDLVHHMKKIDEAKKSRGAGDDARGAVSPVSAARSLRTLNKMSKEEARAWDIGKKDRKRHFVMNYEKTSIRLDDQEDIWFKMESQSLRNGVGMTGEHDNIGVVTPWTPPEEKQLSEIITNTERAQILNNCENQTWNYDIRASAWAGEMFASVLGKNLETEKNSIRNLIEKMVREGILEKVSETVPGRNKAQSILRPKKND